MYDVVQMKNALDQALQSVSIQIQDTFFAAFKEIYPDNCVPKAFPSGKPIIKAVAVSNESDLSQLTSGPGFYIILTNYPVQDNDCRLAAGPLRAVYRGQCREVGLRVMSHLFNAAYLQQHKARSKKYLGSAQNKGKLYYKVLWSQCIKLTPGGPSGINLNRKPYSDYQWLVVVHHMSGSSQDVRKIAETAFDRAFGHPAASRDT